MCIVLLSAMIQRCRFMKLTGTLLQYSVGWKQAHWFRLVKEIFGYWHNILYALQIYIYFSVVFTVPQFWNSVVGSGSCLQWSWQSVWAPACFCFDVTVAKPTATQVSRSQVQLNSSYVIARPVNGYVATTCRPNVDWPYPVSGFVLTWTQPAQSGFRTFLSWQQSPC